MRAASRAYVLATAALAATGAVVAMPFVSQRSQTPVRSIETRLVDADSLLNVPINLLDDVLNIPYNEVEALDAGAASLFDSGTWWVPTATNLWGIDPGDPTHVALLTDTFLPFTGLNDGVGGLQYEIDGLLAAEIPVSASCATETCAPIVPGDVITHIAGIDRDIGFFDSIIGNAPNGASQLFDHWWGVPLSDLTGGSFVFSSATDSGIVDPAGVVYGDPAFTDYLGGTWNPFIGGTGPGDTMPWDGTQYTLNLAQPFENFWQSLEATPSTDGIAGTAIEIPTYTELVQGVQNYAAGAIVDFYPFVEGSTICPSTCSFFPDVPSLVQDVQNAGQLFGTGDSPMIAAWLTDVANGTANEPTAQQTLESVALLQTGNFNLTPAELASVDTQLNDIAPGMAQLYTNLAVITDPSYLDPTTLTETDGVIGTYGGIAPDMVIPDLVNMFQDYQSDPSAFVNLFNAADWAQVFWTMGSGDIPGAAASASTDSMSDLLSTMSTDLSSALSTELSALFANLGANMAPDVANMVAGLF